MNDPLDANKIIAIADRYVGYLTRNGGIGDDPITVFQTTVTDLAQCHKATPLDLDAMLDPKWWADVCHDIGGINRHMDRDTGAMRDCFSPRMLKR